MNSHPLIALVRPAIRELKPYVSARSLSEVGRVFLDANESPDLEGAGLVQINRYPSPQPSALLNRFSSIYGIHSDELLVCRGSDEAIELVVRTFCESGQDRILITPPTYGVYKIAAQIQGAATLEVPMIKSGNSWILPENQIVQAALDPSNRVKVVFLCSPNNPTGTGFGAEQLERIARKIGDSAVVVIDEAYAEWSTVPSLLSTRKTLSNVVILRTLSKAWACAGARCGVAIADPQVIEVLNRVRAPYPISTPAFHAVMDATDTIAADRLLRRIELIRSERNRVSEQLLRLPNVLQVYPSEANFLLIECSDRARILEESRTQGILLRDRHSEPGLENCIRVTLGNRQENDEVLRIFGKGVQ